jgi:hypothetical protein
MIARKTQLGADAVLYIRGRKNHHQRLRCWSVPGAGGETIPPDSCTRIPGYGRGTDGTGRARIAFVRFSQVRGLPLADIRLACKTVGSAYVGSNPTPATTCENAT